MRNHVHNGNCDTGLIVRRLPGAAVTASPQKSSSFDPGLEPWEVVHIQISNTDSSHQILGTTGQLSQSWKGFAK